MRRVGVLIGAGRGESECTAYLAAFLQGLKQLGWTDGRNVRIDIRWGAGNADNIHKHVTELAALAAGRHLGQRHLGPGSVAAGDAHPANRVHRWPTRSVPASSIAWHGRAATPQASCNSNTI